MSPTEILQNSIGRAVAWRDLWRHQVSTRSAAVPEASVAPHAEGQAAFLETRCGADQGSRDEVAALLRCRTQEPHVLAEPIFHVGAALAAREILDRPVRTVHWSGARTAYGPARERFTAKCDQGLARPKVE